MKVRYHIASESTVKAAHTLMDVYNFLSDIEFISRPLTSMIQGLTLASYYLCLS